MLGPTFPWWLVALLNPRVLASEAYWMMREGWAALMPARGLTREQEAHAQALWAATHRGDVFERGMRFAIGVGVERGKRVQAARVLLWRVIAEAELNDPALADEIKQFLIDTDNTPKMEG